MRLSIQNGAYQNPNRRDMHAPSVQGRSFSYERPTNAHIVCMHPLLQQAKSICLQDHRHCEKYRHCFFPLLADEPQPWFLQIPEDDRQPWYMREELHTLQLSNNELESLSDKLAEFRGLKRLELHSNRLSSLPPTLFQLSPSPASPCPKTASRPFLPASTLSTTS